jgi:hypothetical protein
MRGRVNETWMQNGRLATQLLAQYGCRFALPIRIAHTADLSVRSFDGWRIFRFCRALDALVSKLRSFLAVFLAHRYSHFFICFQRLNCQFTVNFGGEYKGIFL